MLTPFRLQPVLAWATWVIVWGWSGGVDAASQLIITPERVSLTSSTDFQQVSVQVRRDDGSTEDVSATAQWSIQNPATVRIDGTVLTPMAEGLTDLTVKYDDLTATIPVEVRDAQAAPPLRFRNDVLPVLTRAGCNTGKCHGSASGKDGFRLSLFGYDPVGDHYRLTREMSGRRLNLAVPEESLLIKKALGEVSHTGGQRLEAGSAHLETVLSWLDAGAVADPADMPTPLSIEVYPHNAVFARKEVEQQLIVVARYSDGSDRDVTDLCVFLSNNDAAATVSEEGLVTGTGSGAAFVLARFDQFTEGTSVIVRPGTPFQFPDLQARNYIDELVFARLTDLHVTPSEVCSDEVFMRRASIDLVGLLPTIEEREAFVRSADPDKREKLVDSLLERPEFTDMWAMKWSEMLQIRTANGGSRKGLQLYDQWLKQRVREGATFNQIVAELLPATGGTFENPSTGYYQTETTPQLLAENVAQALLGTRVQCSSCHNHPFDRWTMDDYYGFAAFFSQVGYKQALDPRELTIYNAGVGDMKHPVDGRAVAPKYLGADAPQIPEGADYRQSLADWLTGPQNTAFTQNIGNVVWAHFMGVGIVEPVDDVRVSNPPSNAALHRELGLRLAGYQFDIKPLIRDICRSRTYQLSTQRNSSNQWDERNFAHGKIRRLRAEVLLDCINQVTNTSERFPGLPEGSRAVQISDGRSPNYFLTTFGRASRETACACEVKTSPTLSQALHLLNGETTSEKISEGGQVAQLMKTQSDPMNVVDQLYLRCLSRVPTEEEKAAIAVRLSEAPEKSEALTDLFWAVLNSNEFIFNH